MNAGEVAGERSRRGGAWLVVFAATVFLGAWLLFQVQPIAGRFLDPWFGGSYAVWTTTLLFFQVGLLVGYLYAHVLVVKLRPRQQALLHVALLLLALLVLPIIPDEGWRPTGEENPTWRILALLTVTVGPPYLLLSTTGPLLQRWFAARYPDRSPYPLYAISNAGSLLALLSYPVVVETLVGLRWQAWGWSAGYAIFVACCAALAWHTGRGTPVRDVHDGDRGPPAPVAGTASVAPDSLRASAGTRIDPARVLTWVGLPAIASTLLMATSNQLTQNVATFPLLWVLPLALYLLTFIIAFAGDRWYRPDLFRPMLAISLAAAVYALYNPLFAISWQILFYSAALFSGALLLHAETVRRRPGARHLTVFYLAFAVGGALGGVFVALLAPLIFNALWEYHLALLATALLPVLLWWRDLRAEGEDVWSDAARGVVLAGLGAVVLAGFLASDVHQAGDGVIAADRNFYGVVRIYERETGSPDEARYVMQHGDTVHGFQYLAEDRRLLPTGYYGPQSGVGLVFEQFERPSDRPLAVGGIGLGAGMLSVYATADERWHYYEINELVTEMAEAHFTFLADARARDVETTVVHGDGRTLMERELEQDGSREFDILVLDAFSSGAIPSHLLTLEAFDLYLDHLRPDGVIAVHISNRHVDLAPVLHGAAEARGLESRLVVDDSTDTPGTFTTEWVIVTANESFLTDAGLAEPGEDLPRRVRWTDDHHTLYPLLRLY